MSDCLALAFCHRALAEQRAISQTKNRNETPAPKKSPAISGAQVRAARAMVGWTARALAKKAIVPMFTLEWIGAMER
jgi:hypothetical protein